MSIAKMSRNTREKPVDSLGASLLARSRNIEYFTNTRLTSVPPAYGSARFIPSVTSFTPRADPSMNAL